jgi:PE-PGRS C-terminal aspartyl peptidase-like domain
VPVIVDTGSQGILVPPQDVNFATLGPKTNTSPLTTPNYGFGNNYDVFTYDTYTAPVNLGNGIVTAPTTVDVMVSGTQYKNGVPSPIDLAYATPKMGVGQNTQVVVAPNPVQALPGTLAQGVLLNNPGNSLQFGANPLNYYASVPGAPISNAPNISITDPTTATSSTPVNAHGYIDSGGIQGGLPSDALPSTQTGDTFVPNGDIVSFYTGDPASGGTLLYTYTVSGSNPPVFPSGFNSGIIPFSGAPGYGLIAGTLSPAPNGMPIYVSYSPSYGTMYFDY